MTIKTNYFPYNSEKAHGMTATEFANSFDAMMNRNGELIDSVFFTAYGENGLPATPKFMPFGLTGFAYDIKTDARPDWHIDFTIFDKDLDFTGQYIELDVNSGSGKTMKNFYVDPVTGDLVGLSKTGHTVVIDGTFSADGSQLTYSIDNEVLQDITGSVGVVKGQFAGEHWGDSGASSYFEIKIA